MILAPFSFTNVVKDISLMSETCIVCLGDLGGGAADLPPSVTASTTTPPRDSTVDKGSPSRVHTPTPRGDDAESGFIAHLKPCGHNLHDECLTPWVERANSCPICRQSFNLVELSNFIGGKLKVVYEVT